MLGSMIAQACAGGGFLMALVGVLVALVLVLGAAALAKYLFTG